MAFQVCPLCKGSGVFEFKECPVCKGKRIIDNITGLPPKSNEGNVKDNQEDIGVKHSEDSIEQILRKSEENNKQFWHEMSQKNWFEYPQFESYPPSSILC